MMNTLLARRIAAMIPDFPGGPRNAVICRTRAGRALRAQGAWSWSIEPIYGPFSGREIAGSQWPASEVAGGGFELHRSNVKEWTKEFSPVP